MRKDGATEEATACPMCSAAVTYRGRGRRPVYCSTRCKNRAANVRAAVRDGAPLVEVVHVKRKQKPRPSRATRSYRDRRDVAAIERVRRSPRLQSRLFEAIRRDVAARRYWYTEHPRSPWHVPRVELARLATLWLPHRQFETPPTPIVQDKDEDALARILAELEQDDFDHPE